MAYARHIHKEDECRVFLEKNGRSSKRLTKCQLTRKAGIDSFFQKHHVPIDSGSDFWWQFINLGEESIERLAIKLVAGSRFLLDYEHARCPQPQDYILRELTRVLRRVPSRTPKLEERLKNLGGCLSPHSRALHGRLEDTYQYLP